MQGKHQLGGTREGHPGTADPGHRVAAMGWLPRCLPAGSELVLKGPDDPRVSGLGHFGWLHLRHVIAGKEVESVLLTISPADADLWQSLRTMGIIFTLDRKENYLTLF